MTTPPPADNDPGRPEPAWAPPDPEAAEASPPAPAEPPASSDPPALPESHAPPESHVLPEAGPVSVPVRTNRLAIAALVTGVLGLIAFAVAFAIAALVQIDRGRGKGRGLAVGALAAAVAWAAGGIVALAAYGSPFTARDDSEAPRADGFVHISSLKIGDCFSAKVHDSADPFVDPSPCNHPHNGEVTAKVTLPDGPFPGYRELSGQARAACGEQVRGKVPQAADKEFEPRPGLPDEESWSDGKREVTCTLVYIGDDSLTTSLATRIAPPKPRGYPLKRGDCIKKWDEMSYGQPLVKCGKKHEMQVLAIYELNGGEEYPGREKLEERALSDCAEYAVKAWGANPPFDRVDVAVVVPSEDDWRWDVRQAICLVVGKHGPFRGSVVPH